MHVRAQIMQGERGIVAHVKLPKAKELAQYGRLHLDFALGCPGAHGIQALSFQQIPLSLGQTSRIYSLHACSMLQALGKHGLNVSGTSSNAGLHCKRHDGTCWLMSSNINARGMQGQRTRTAPFGTTSSSCLSAARRMGAWRTATSATPPSGSRRRSMVRLLT